MRAIRDFLDQAVVEFGEYRVVLTGYNSARFDLEYLRTSLIRNGFNPYFKVVNRDLFFLSRKLYVSEPEFPRVENPAEPGRISLRLESLCSAFGLLTGPQLHESSADVKLTIALAQRYLEDFGLDVRQYSAYEPRELDAARPGTLIERLTPLYDSADPSRSEACPYVLLDSNYRYALWINLRRFEELRAKKEPAERAVEFFKLEGSEFFSDLRTCKGKDTVRLAAEAFEQLKRISLRNFFKESDCDIEAQIVRIDHQNLDVLHRRLWQNEADRALSEDARRILVRFKLANAPDGSPGLDAKLRDYALYRYGGRMKLSRWSQETFEEGVLQEGFHPAFSELMEEIDTCEAAAVTEDDRTLMKALRQFYLNSHIYRVCGKELEQIRRKARPVISSSLTEPCPFSP